MELAGHRIQAVQSRHELGMHARILPRWPRGKIEGPPSPGFQMSLSGFHPLVARWFTDCVGTPTNAQLRGWTAIREGRHTLIAAPTGSGKTLAAFLTAIDGLVRESTSNPLPDEVRVVYVSPLKALSTDIHKNLAEPR